MTTDSDSATILIVDDEQPLADLFAQFLSSTYAVRTVYNGQDALEQMSDEVDIVLLDRRMPGLSGEEVLRAIREEGYKCRVAMVTAVEPDVDILEMGFDDYLMKPVTNSELTKLVENLLELNDAEAPLQEYYRLTSKKTALAGEMSGGDLSDDTEHDEFEQLASRMAELDRDYEAVKSEEFRSLLERFANRSHAD